MILAMSLNSVILIVVSIVFLIGLVLFYLSGLITVQKGTFSVIEKIGIFHKILLEGKHYSMPLSTRRVATYYIDSKRIVIVNGLKVEITISICDGQKYHYSAEKIDDLLAETNKLNFQDVTEYILYLSDKLSKVGCILKQKESKL